MIRTSLDDTPDEPEEGGGAFTVPYWKIDLLLSILGALPRSRTKPYLPCIHPLKSTLIYCVMILSIISYSVYDTFSTYMSKINNGMTFHQILTVFVGLSTLMTFTATPTLYLDIPVLRRSLLSWMNLTKEFHRITGMSLLKQVIYVEYVLLFFIFFIPLTSLPLATLIFSNAKMQWKSLPQSIHGAIVLASVMLGWAGKCACLGQIAVSACENLQKKLKSGAKAEVIFDDFRSLWYHIRAVTKYMSSHSLSLIFTITLFRTMVFGYNIFISFYTKAFISGAFYMYLTLIMLLQIFFMSYISRSSSQKLQTALCNVSHDVYKSTTNSTTHLVILQFVLTESKNPPSLLFNKFYHVNQTFFTMALSILSSFIVVLVQYNLPNL